MNNNDVIIHRILYHKLLQNYYYKNEIIQNWILNIMKKKS